MAKRTIIAPDELTVSDIERFAKLPTVDWHGNCYGLACIAAQLLGEPHVPVYGHYVGEVDRDGWWGRRADMPFQQHGWVLLGDGRVLDPTRWSFENVPPYIFVSASAGHPDYDEGGNAWRSSLMRPPPKRGEHLGNGPSRSYELKLGPEAGRLVATLLGPTEIDLKFGGRVTCSTNQVFWLANAPYTALGEHVFTIYQAIASSYGSAAIPLDNRRRAERESGRQLQEKPR